MLTKNLKETTTSEITGYSIHWLRKKRCEGGGPPFRKIGRSIRYPEDELVNWINEHQIVRSTSEYK